MSRLNALIDRLTGQSFGLTNYGNLEADINYLVVAGASLASATTLTITSEFHIVTGTTTVATLTDVLGAVTGQQVRLLFQSGLTVQNNGGGTGNIRTATGSDRLIRPNEIVSFVYDGTVWREQRPASGTVVAYGTKTSTVSTTGTTFAAGADLLASTLSFTADGVSDYLVRVAAPAVAAGSNGNATTLRLNLDAADAGNITETQSASLQPLAAATVIVAPTAGAHTVNVRLVSAVSGTAQVNGGAGGAGTDRPIVVSIERL